MGVIKSESKRMRRREKGREGEEREKEGDTVRKEIGQRGLCRPQPSKPASAVPRKSPQTDPQEREKIKHFIVS